jgi:hypothetical protein
LQVAAETGQALGFAFRPMQAAGNPSPAALRNALDASPRQLRVLKCRGGIPPARPVPFPQLGHPELLPRHPERREGTAFRSAAEQFFVAAGRTASDGHRLTRIAGLIPPESVRNGAARIGTTEA